MAKRPAVRAATGPKADAPSPAHRIVALVGKELFLQAEHLAQLRQALTDAHGEVDTIRFDGAATPAADILDECRTFGLMQQHKLVVVDNADQFVKEDQRPLVERYAQGPCEGATLVLRADKWNKSQLDALIEQVGVFVACAPVGPAKAAEWAVKRCAKRHGRAIEPGAAALLVERLGPDLGRIDSELAKLAVAAEGDGPITRADVVEAVGATREEEFWSVQSALLCGDPREALGQLRLVLDNARHDMAVPVSWAMLDLARKVHGASRGLRQGAREWDLAGPLKLWGQSKDAVLAAGRRVEPARAAALLAAAVRVDQRMKSGYGDPARGLEGLALRFAAAADAVRARR